VPFLDIVTEGTPYLVKYRPPLQILAASWGLDDVTATVQIAMSRRTLTIQASTDALGDGLWPGVTKSLDVIYQYGGEQPQLAIATEGQRLSIDYTRQEAYEPDPDPRVLNVIKAAYGKADVTDKARSLVTGDGLRFKVSADLFGGDNWPGTPKSLLLAFSWGPLYTYAAAPPGGADREGFILTGDGTSWDLSLRPPQMPVGQLI
jgi:hypothetical protein